MKNVLLINPRFPPLHHNYDHVLPMLGAKFIAPPLSLLTIAALIPDRYEVRVVDMNVSELANDHLRWADMVLVTGIGAQSESILDVCRRVRDVSREVVLVVGGLHVSVYPEKVEPYADTIVRGESEAVLRDLFSDAERGRLAKVYNTDMNLVDLRTSPCPRFELVDPSDYLIWTVQYSRGCPYECAFCELRRFYGRQMRVKKIDEFMRELQSVHGLGFRGPVMFGDDNFHHAPGVKELLERIREWQIARRYPFTFFTQTDIQIAREPGLLQLMSDAGFNALQIGMESPCEDSLRSMAKTHNIGHDMTAAVRTIQEHGMEVLPAMLLGSDGDPADIFDIQYRFLQEAGTPRIMVSLLRVFRGSDMYVQMRGAGRILDDEPSGNQTGEFSLNFRSCMGNERLLQGATDLVQRLYSPENYFDRCWTCIRHLRVRHYGAPTADLGRAMRRVWNYVRQSRCRTYNRLFARFMVRVLFRYPAKLGVAFSLGVLGYHYHLTARRATNGGSAPVARPS